MISIDGFPYSNVWVKEESVFSNNLQSIFLIVLKKEDNIQGENDFWRDANDLESKNEEE